MSLTNFLDLRDVNDKLKPLRPKVPRRIPAELRVKPRSKRYMVVGTAFDYLLRFELQRRAPHALTEPWSAELSTNPHLLSRVVAKSSPADFQDVWIERPELAVMSPSSEWFVGDAQTKITDIFRAVDGKVQQFMLPKRAREIVESAKAASADYLKTKAPQRSQLMELAAHALRLAKLDDVARSLRLDPRFGEADIEDLEDLLSMLEIVPFDLLVHSGPLLLNPTFKETSKLVGGADADLIAGEHLVDFKVTIKADMNGKDLDQLLGYFLLARKQRSIDPSFPQINHVGLYFCRHGHLWTHDVKAWTQHPEFPDIEQWFFNRAKEVFGTGRPTTNTGIHS